MIYTILSKLPESGYDKDTRYHYYAVELGPFYYTDEAEANSRKEQLDREFPDWQNEVISLVEI